jgi:hypothetical protein
MLEREHVPYAASFRRHPLPAVSSLAMACFLNEVDECDQWGLRLADQWAMMLSAQINHKFR